MKLFCLHTAIIGEDDIVEDDTVFLSNIWSSIFFPEMFYQHRGTLVRKKLRFRKMKLSK